MADIQVYSVYKTTWAFYTIFAMWYTENSTAIPIYSLRVNEHVSILSEIFPSWLEDVQVNFRQKIWFCEKQIYRNVSVIHVIVIAFIVTITIAIEFQGN